MIYELKKEIMRRVEREMILNPFELKRFTEILDDIFENFGMIDPPLQNARRHKSRHIFLHRILDELVADFIQHNKTKVPTQTTVTELMIWSHKQTIKPEE